MQLDSPYVVSVIKSEIPKGYIVTFADGRQKLPVHFPHSYFKEEKIDLEIFLTWAALHSPLKKENFSADLVIQLAAQIDLKVKKE